MVPKVAFLDEVPTRSRRQMQTLPRMQEDSSQSQNRASVRGRLVLPCPQMRPLVADVNPPAVIRRPSPAASASSAAAVDRDDEA